MFNSPSTPPSPKLTRETATMDGPPAANTPRRIQLRRTKGWRKPEGAIVVSRPTKWGNPWRVDPTMQAQWSTATRELAVALFRDLVEYDIADALGGYPTRAEIREQLAGHDLACWCPLDAPCHGDVLLELANGAAS